MLLSGSKYALLNVKVVLSTLLRNYKIKSKRRQKEWTLVAETTLKRREGFLIGIEPRDYAPLLNKTSKREKEEIELINNQNTINTLKDYNDNFCNSGVNK